MADTFLEEATSVKENDPYEVAAAGQVLAADGLGGVGWQNPSSVVLVQDPPFSKPLPNIFVWDEEEIGGIEAINIDLTSIVPSLATCKAVLLRCDASESGGEFGANIFFRLYDTTRLVSGTRIETGRDVSFTAIVPLDEGRITIVAERMGTGVFVSATLTVICGFR